MHRFRSVLPPLLGLLALLLVAAASPTSDAPGVGITDKAAVLQRAHLPLPAAGQAFRDPTFGTDLVRVSGTSGQGGWESHIYNQLQAFSSDNEYLLLTGADGYVVRRVSDRALVGGLDTGTWNAARWHPARPHVLVHYDSNDDTTVRVQLTDVDTLTTATAYIFPAQYHYIRPAQSFDELSHDGRWMAGLLTRDDGEQVVFSLDLEDQVLTNELALSSFYSGACETDPVWGRLEPDWVGVSPLGTYLVVQWPRAGTMRCSGLETFDISTGGFRGRVQEGTNHGDLGLDADGRTEIFMTTEFGPPEDHDRLAIVTRRLPGTETVSPPIWLTTVDWSDEGHISMKGPPGVGLVSWGRFVSDGDTPGEHDYAFQDELFLQYTDGRVLRLTHHRSSVCGYWVQPRASISRDGRYVVFASDWGQETGVASCSTEAELGGGDPFLIDLRGVFDRRGQDVTRGSPSGTE